MTKKRGLTAREQDFCQLLHQLGNPAEAAVRAGFQPEKAHVQAARLLRRSSVQKELARLRKQEQGGEAVGQALSGLRRIALGSSEDAVRLALDVCDPDNGETCREKAGSDYFRVSGIKRTKGGVELSFYDRIKALEVLLEWGRSQGGGQEKRDSIYDALERSAEKLAGSGGDDCD